MESQNVMDEILDKVNEIPLEDQGILAELIKNRYREKDGRKSWQTPISHRKNTIKV